MEGGGNQTIINSSFYLDPIRVLVNDVLDSSCKKSCEISSPYKVQLDFEDGVVSTENMFYGLSIIEVDMSLFDTSKVTSMESMFRDCQKLKKINFGEINTSSVVDMSHLFDNCLLLESLDLSHFDTSSVVKMSYMFMFSTCDKLVSIDLSNFNTSSLEEMNDLLSYCRHLLFADLSNFDTSKVKNMQGIFYCDERLKFLDLRNFDGTLVTNFALVFGYLYDVYFINLKKFKLIEENVKDKHEAFEQINNYVKYCIKDDDTRGFLLGSAISQCSDICFQRNIDVEMISLEYTDKDGNYEYKVECKCKEKYKYEFQVKCYNECPGNNVTYQNGKYGCDGPVGENYYLDPEEEMYMKCYSSCKNCSKGGNIRHHNCDNCISGFKFLNDSSVNPNNCYEQCQYYYYFNETNHYVCTPTESCPSNFNKLIITKLKCIDDCKKDDQYQYEYKNNCTRLCPENTYIYEAQKLCLDECYPELFKYGNECYDDCPSGKHRFFTDRNTCLDSLIENYYLDSNDNIYKKCYSTCKTCSKAGNETNHNCNECITNYIFLNDSLVPSQNCYKKCDHFYYFNESNQYECTQSEECPSLFIKFISQKNRCIDDCQKDDLYKYEYKNNCMAQCPENTKKYEEQKLCLDECYQQQFEYEGICYDDDCPTGKYKFFEDRNICVDSLQENYYPDTPDNIYKKCFDSCKRCSQGGNETHNNCRECIDNYKFLNDDSSVPPNNCYEQCTYNYYYFNAEGQYTCSPSNSCPEQYSKLIEPLNKCIDDCKNDHDDEYLYEYGNKCFKQCPGSKKTYEEQKLCLDDCYPEQFEYNNICYNNCPTGTHRLFQNRNICVETLPENYYLDTDNIYKKCYNLCQRCSQGGDETHNNCQECINDYLLLNGDSSATPNNCYRECPYNYYYFNAEGQYTCSLSNSCPEQYSKLIEPLNKCIDDCKNDHDDEYLYEYENKCFKQCPGSKKTYEEHKLCLDDCYPEQFEYNNICYNNCPTGTHKLFQNRNICVETLPENYYLDSDNIYKECYDLCKKCSQPGNETNHNCDICIDNYKFINDPLAPQKNCYIDCNSYYYFNEDGQYTCTSSDSCPTQYSKSIESQNKCIDDCKNDDKLKYEYNNKCIEECPDGLKTIVEEKKCVESCNENQLEIDNLCYNEFSNENKNIQNIRISNISNFDSILNNAILPKYSPAEGNTLTFETEETVTQVTSSKTELELLKNLSNIDLNITIVDLGDCEEILRKAYNINENDPLIFVKTEDKSDKASQKNVKFEVLEPYNKTRLNLSLCDESPINLIIPMDISEETKQLYEQMKESGYDMFDINDPFYQDICTPFDSGNGTDILLSDRVDYIYNTENTQCQSNCQFSYYSVESKYMNCSCSASQETNQTEISTKKEDKFSAKKIYESFYDVLKYSNYNIMKCFNIVSDGDLIIKNIGSCIVIIYFVFYLGCLGIYIYNGIAPLKTRLKYDIKDVIEKNNLDLAIDLENVLNPPIKRKSKLVTRADIIREKEKKIAQRNLRNIKLNNQNRINSNNNIQIYSNFVSSKGTLEVSQSEKKDEFKIKEDYKPNNIISSKDMLDMTQNEKDGELQIKEKYTSNKTNTVTEGGKKSEKFSDFELNELEYNEAIDKDKRTLLQLYWATLKREHLIIFTFINCDDYNLLSIKLARFIFLVCTDMALNVFFFSDDSMHKLFLSYGKYDFVQQIPQITYSTIITQLIELFLCFLSLTDKHIYRIRTSLLKGKTANIPKIIRCMQIKLIIFFCFIGIFFVMYWYIISVFCGVYRNTQIKFLKDSAISFSISLAYPFALYLLSTGLRKCAVNDSKYKRFKCIYAISNIIPFF